MKWYVVKSEHLLVQNRFSRTKIRQSLAESSHDFMHDKRGEDELLYMCRKGHSSCYPPRIS